jgi:hypothetical protein
MWKTWYWIAWATVTTAFVVFDLSTHRRWGSLALDLICTALNVALAWNAWRRSKGLSNL